MSPHYAKFIESQSKRKRNNNFVYLDIYESDCENIDQFVNFLHLDYPSHNNDWRKEYISFISQEGNIFYVERIVPSY